jgi:hypothetical protein
VLVAFVGFLLTAVGTPSGEPATWRGPRTTFSVAILEKLPGAVRALSFVPAPPYWRPTDSDVAAAEALLAKQLKPRFANYGRQYLGVTVAEKRVLQVRGFCWSYYRDGPERYWERTPVSTLDSGGCVFQANYDPSTGTLGTIEWGTAGP